MLSVLRLAEFIYEQLAFPDIEYTFKHALTQEVAYNSVLIERRRLLHERAAQSIEELFADRLDDHLTALAHHFERSGNVPKAMEYVGRAGAKAAQQAAHSEAIGYFSRALELLRGLPDGAAPRQPGIRSAAGPGLVMFVARGPRASPERESALVRARELCEHLEDTARLMETLLALAHTRILRREFEPARELAERVVAMAQHAKAPPMLAGAHVVLGFVRFITAQFQAAREHAERAIELGVLPSRNFGALFAQLAPSVLVDVLSTLGYPSKARSRIEELLAIARRSGPFSIVTALLMDGLQHIALHPDGGGASG
jgi:tetratricopeptide (TPR) repeat protein